MTRRITPSCCIPTKYGDKVTLLKQLIRELICSDCYRSEKPFSHRECGTCPFCQGYERLGGDDQ